MRISGVEAFLVKEQFIFIKVSTDDGLVGWGEANYHGAYDTVQAAVKIGSELIGKNPNELGRIWNTILKHGYRIGTTGIRFAAMSGIDIALHDIKGQALGVPVYELLGGKIRDEVPVYASLMIRGLDAETEIGRVGACLEKGYKTVKLHLATGWTADDRPSDTLSIIQALRDVWPDRDQLGLAVDVNGAYSAHEATRIGKGLEDLDVWWFEEPLAATDHAGYDKLQQALTIPISAGEQECNIWQFRDLMLRAKVDIIQPNITSAGGYTQGAKIAALAEALNKPISGHNTEPTLMTAAQVHTWVSWPMCNLPQEYYGEPSHPIRDEVKAVIFDDLRIEGGFAYPSSTPGIGVTIDEVALRKHSVSLTA